MDDEKLVNAEDFRKASDAAFKMPVVYDRAMRLGDLLEAALAHRRESKDGSEELSAVIATLRARVARAHDDLTVFVNGEENPEYKGIDYAELQAKLAKLRPIKEDRPSH